MAKTCNICDAEIPAERVEALPDVRLCVKCAEKNPPPPKDPNEICARSASGGRNGFAPND